MKIQEIISLIEGSPEAAVLDILTVMAGEGLDTANFDMIKDQLSSSGIDLDDNSLFDLLNNLAIVRNIKDRVVFFNTDSDQSHNQDLEVDPEKDAKHVSKMAKKQVDKELKK